MLLVVFLLVLDVVFLAVLCVFFLARLGIGFDASSMDEFCITRNTPELSLFLLSLTAVLMPAVLNRVLKLVSRFSSSRLKYIIFSLVTFSVDWRA